MDECLSLENTTSAVNLSRLKSLSLSQRQLCDVECLLNGAFFPLTGFLDERDFQSVCERMRLANGTLWPIPVTLDVLEDFAHSVQLGEQIILTGLDNTPIALLTITSLWKPNKHTEAMHVFGTHDLKHPGVHYLYDVAGMWYIGGPIQMLSTPRHYDFVNYRHTPAELKQLFDVYGWTKIVAFQTRNPMHRAHFELTQRAARDSNAHLLIHPVTGMTKPGDVDYVTRVKCYIQILEKYEKHSAMLSLLPLAMRMAGPREAVWHGVIRKNYGVTHFIVGRDHAGPGLNSQGMSFYEPLAAQQLLLECASEIGITAIPFSAIVYAKEKQQFLTMEEISPTDTVDDISGTQLRQKLAYGLPIPDWFTFPELQSILQKAYPPKEKQGLTLFFTGLSGSGKSTLAKALQARLNETTNRTVTLLDGDILRKGLSSELGFTPADRDTHICRVGLLASEITKHHGIAICAAIAPYAKARDAVRGMISQYGGFFEIYVETPIDICKARDVKGLYQKADLGLVKNFTGVSSPYEPPLKPEIVIDTSKMGIFDAIDYIVGVLQQHGWVKPEL